MTAPGTLDDGRDGGHSSEIPLYTKSDVRRMLEQASGGTLPTASHRGGWSDDEVRAEVVRVATRASQIAVANMDHARSKVPVDGDESDILSRVEILALIDERFARHGSKLMADFGLPIKTEEEKRQTILKINRLLSLGKFVWTVITTILGVIGSAGGIVLAYLLTHGHAG